MGVNASQSGWIRAFAVNLCPGRLLLCWILNFQIAFISFWAPSQIFNFLEGRTILPEAKLTESGWWDMLDLVVFWLQVNKSSQHCWCFLGIEFRDALKKWLVVFLVMVLFLVRCFILHVLFWVCLASVSWCYLDD